MDRHINILHLEDDPNDAELIMEELASGNIRSRITVVQTRDEFNASLHNGLFDIILSDYKLPMFNGITALQIVQEQNLDIPFIFVSGTMGEDAAIETLTQGATDYVLKNKRSRLVPAVKRAFEDLTQKRERNRIAHMMQVRLRVFEKTYLAGITLNDACTIIIDEIESQTGSTIGFIHFLGGDQKTIDLQTWSTNTHSKLCTSQEYRHRDNIQEAGVWAECIQKKKPVVHNDYASLPNRKGLPTGHVQMVRELLVPIIRSGLIVAIMGVGNKATDYDETDIKNISLLGDLSWEIIERIKSEEALRKSEERYRMLFESSPVSVWEEDFSEVKNLMDELRAQGVDDLETYLEHHPEFVQRCINNVKILDMNQAAVILHEAPDKKSLFEGLSKRFTPESVDIFRQELIILWHGETEVTIDGSLKTLSGKIRNVTLYFTVCPGYEKSYAKILTSIVDITDRKRTEVTLRKLSHIVEQSPVSILLTDPKGRIEYVNPKYISVSGYHQDELLGEKPAVLLQIEKDEETSISLQQQIASGKEWRGEIQFQNKNGAFFWENVNISPIRDDNNIISHFIIIKEDITEQKKLESRFRQTEKLEVIGQLVGGVAHDFNNMLHIILGLSRIELKKHDPTQKVHKNLTEIQKAAQRAADITRQLLAFASKQMVVPKLLYLNDTVKGLIQMLRRLIGENIELNWVPGKELDPVLIDPGQIDQILINLCVNSRDAIANVGKISIETKKAVFDDAYCKKHPGAIPGKYSQILVSDDGSGMDKTTLSRLFEPFFTTKESGKGTGLGLATVFGIVKQNNGFILVNSELGHGSTFMISLPAKNDINVQEPITEKPHKVVKGSDTIMLVEDEPVLINIVKNMLEQIGYKVFTASKPSAAVEIAKEHPGKLHLLLTDVVMPEMNGFELAKLIKQIHPEIRCLFMSAYPGNVIDKLGVGNGEIEIMQKPFTIQTLATKLNNLP